MSSASLCPCRVHPRLTATDTRTDSEQYQIDQQQQLAYADCCQPLHQGEAQAQTAEQLMRSRYSAFVLYLSEYIVNTTLPAQQALLDKDSIECWAQETQWAGLEILQHKPKLGKRHAQVEFKAYFHQLDQGNLLLDAHHELSSFVLAHNKNTDKRSQPAQWYFLDPTVRLKVTQKQPCLCGSGEKFKRCCGQLV